MKIITTSSLIPRNGIDTLIQACGLLKIKWQLTIAGDGPERQKLEELAEKLEIRPKVQFLGRVLNSKIPQLLKTSDIFVRPSRFEGFGASFIEAMAVGLPTIGTPVGGIVDFLTDNKTGFMVLPDKPIELAKKIEFIHDHPKLAKKVASAGQKLVRQKYNWDKIADKVFEQWKIL